MNIQNIANLFCFAALVYMYCDVEVLPFSSKWVKYTVIGGTCAIIAANITVPLLFPGIVIAQTALFTQSVPSLIMCWIIAKHKDLRFLFVFCSLDILGFMILLIVNSLSIMLGLSETVQSGLSILFMLPFIYLFYRYGKIFGRIISNVKKHWRTLTIFSLTVYGFSYFLTLYPEPWRQRPEMAPVIMGYAALILIGYVLIIRAVINMGHIINMEKEELRLKLELEKRGRELEEKKSRILISQIEPHFIYNALMSIRYLIKKEPDTACEMVYDFSKYLRSNIDSLTENDFILWRTELEHIEAYVRIEKARFKERLNVVYEIEDVDFYIPPLTVEPLVENAIKHGVSKRIRGGTVWICSKETEYGHQISVKDDGVGFDAENLEMEKQVGLNYIRTQLSLVPGAEMKIESKAGEGTKVTVIFKKTAGEENEDHSCR